VAEMKSPLAKAKQVFECQGESLGRRRLWPMPSDRTSVPGLDTTASRTVDNNVAQTEEPVICPLFNLSMTAFYCLESGTRAEQQPTKTTYMAPRRFAQNSSEHFPYSVR